MRIKKLDERVELLRQLYRYAFFTTDPTQESGCGKDVNFEPLWEADITSSELATMTQLCQVYFRLPIYTVAHAAAWLGLSKRGVVEAYRAKRLPYIKPGREVLFLHEDLVKFAQERRYEL